MKGSVRIQEVEGARAEPVEGDIAQQGCSKIEGKPPLPVKRPDSDGASGHGQVLFFIKLEEM